MSGVVEFLLARLDEDEALAGEAVTAGEPWRSVTTDEQGFVLAKRDNHTWIVAQADYSPHAEHIARHDPARILADVAAKRRILDRCKWVIEHPEYGGDMELAGHFDDARDTIDDLVTIYSDHPDCQERWRP